MRWYFRLAQTHGFIVRLARVTPVGNFERMKACTATNSAQHSTSRLARAAAIFMVVILLTNPASAAFHLWNIREVYTDNSGSVQFIEFFTSSSSQQFVGGQQVVVRNIGNTLTHTFTVPSNLPGDSANKAFLLGTSSLQPVGGPAPDYIIPDNFLFPAGGTITFFGANSGAYTALPVDGLLSRTWGDGNALNSPQNFAGQLGVVPEPNVLALFAAGIGFWLVLRRRA
jgi:hypothetical protein